MCTPMSYAGSAPDSRHWGFGKHSSPDWGLWIMILYEPYPGTDFAEGRRTGRGCCAKRGPWSWPNNHSLFSVAMRCLSGLQLSPAFLSSSHSHCPCTCCSITCQPTKTQRLWIICQCLNCWNCVSPGHFFSHRACVLYFFQEQKFLVGVILMVPCYAVESVRCYVAALLFVQQITTAFAVQVRITSSYSIFIYCLTFYDYSCSTYHW